MCWEHSVQYCASLTCAESTGLGAEYCPWHIIDTFRRIAIKGENLPITIFQERTSDRRELSNKKFMANAFFESIAHSFHQKNLFLIYDAFK